MHILRLLLSVVKSPPRKEVYIPEGPLENPACKAAGHIGESCWQGGSERSALPNEACCGVTQTGHVSQYTVQRVRHTQIQRTPPPPGLAAIQISITIDSFCLFFWPGSLLPHCICEVYPHYCMWSLIFMLLCSVPLDQDSSSFVIILSGRLIVCRLGSY